MAGTARIRHSFLVLSLVLVASAAGAFSTSGAVSADERSGSYSVTDVSLVYLGNPRLFRRPCVLSADRVYRAIPEYREILEKNLTDRDVRYHFLMKKASDKFATAIREVSQSGGFDLVAGIGSVIASTTDTPVPPDVTATAISKLPLTSGCALALLVPRSRLALAVLAAALSCIGDGRSLAEDGPRAARARLDPAEVSESSWIGTDGRKRLLFRPRFVPPPLLLAGVLALNVGPMDVVLDAVRSRILVTGTPDQVEDALHVFSYVDVPTPEVLVEVAVVETACRCRSETGGHTYFDRTGGPDTFFRSFRYDFEPEAWLRAQQVGERPFQGASVRLGDSRWSGTLAGTIEAVLRGLAHDGSSDVVARPSLVLTEGVPAHVESTLALPVLLFERSDTPWQRQATRRRVGEKTGVRLDVTAEMVGSDGARLTIHPWVRRVAAAEADEGPLGLPTLAVSELLTTIHVADGETVLVGGIEGRRRVRGRRGLPLLDALPALDGALSARGGEAEETDLQVLLRARILRPGRAPPRFAPPCEAERLRARTAAEGLKGQPAGASRAGASPVK